VPFPQQDFEDVKEGASLIGPLLVNDGVVWPPFDKVYPKVTVGRNKEFVLDFEAPLTVGTVSVTTQGEGGGELIALVEHPVDDDYSKVKLESFTQEGTANVRAQAGDGSTHRYLVAVDRNAGKTAYPPEVKLSSTEDAIEVKIIPNEQNTTDEVAVVSYEVWRRDWSDPLASFELAANVRAEDIAPTGRERQPAGAGFAPFGPRAPGRTQTQEAGLVWNDRTVDAGESYSYKVRTVGDNTFPAESEFSDAILIEASPSVDFKWTSSSLDKVGCDIVKSFGGQIDQKNFWVRTGDEIGGVASGGAAVGDLNFKTGFFLVDFHRQVILPGIGVTDRMVYADESGDLHERLRGQTKTDLWDKVGAPRRPGPGPVGPMGIGMPTGMPTGMGRRPF
jgi:hypothetical protein